MYVTVFASIQPNDQTSLSCPTLPHLSSLHRHSEAKQSPPTSSYSKLGAFRPDCERPKYFDNIRMTQTTNEAKYAFLAPEGFIARFQFLFIGFSVTFTFSNESKRISHSLSKDFLYLVHLEHSVRNEHTEFTTGQSHCHRVQRKP